MNRRTFLLGLGAAACSGTPKAEPPHRRRGSNAPVDARGVEPTEEVVLANVQRSPIAIYRDRMVQETRTGELAFWDASSMTKVGTIALRTHGFCFLSYGALAALVQPRGEKHIEVHLIDGNRTVRVLRGPELETEIDAEVVVGASPTELYISDAGYDVVRLELGDEVRATGRLRVELKPRLTLRQLTSLGDGRVVVRGETALSILEPKKPAVEVVTGGTIPVHLAAASSKRVWYSHTPKLVPPREVSLVRVDGGKRDAHVELAGEIWHMASGAGALALLVHGEHAWSVVVVEESGSERWRADVPAENLEAIAIAEHRVVVVDRGGGLRAWDAATGKSVG